VDEGRGSLVARHAPRVCGWFAMVLGAVVLLGWALDVGFLKGPLAGGTSMKPNTAASVVLAGASLLLLTSPRRVLRPVSALLALGPLVVGVVTMTEWMAGRDLGIDQLLFTEAAGTAGTGVPGRMAGISALSLALLGGALLLLVLDRAPAIIASQVLATAAGLVAILGLLPELYGARSTGGVLGRQTQMTASTAVALMVLGSGVLATRADRGFLRVTTTAGPGGALARRALPVVFLVPVLLGWLAMAGQRVDLYDSGYRASVVTAASAGCLAIFVIVAARMLDRTEARREHAERLRGEMFRSNPSPSWVTRMSDGLFVDANQAFADTFGRSREEIVGRTSLELNVWVDPSERDALMQELRTGDTVEGAEVRLRAADGRVFPVLFSARMVVFEGEPRVVGSLLDVTEVREAEDLLRQREAELREAQRIAHVGSWTLDPATDHVTWTDELHLMFGLEPGQPTPDYSAQQRLFTPESWERLTTALSGTQATGVPYEVELEMRRADGSTGWMLARGETVRDASGAIVGLRGTAQDITERKRAEDERQRSAMRLEALHGIAFDILAAQSAEELARVALSRLRELVPAMRATLARYHDASQELENVAVSTRSPTRVGVGVRFPMSAAGPPDRLLRGEVNLVDDTLALEEPSPAVRGLIEEGVRTYVNVPMVFGGRLIGTLNLSADTPGGFADEHIEVAREVAAMLAVAFVQSDFRIEQQRQNEILEARVIERTAALTESESRLQAIIENAAPAIWAKDPEGRYLFLNPAAEVSLGRPRAEIVGKTDHDLLPPEVAERLRREDRSVLETGAMLRAEESRELEDGLHSWLTVRFPLLDAAGTPYAVCGIATDITEIRRREEEAQVARAEAESATRAKDEFLSRMSHELRTPLNSVLGFAQVLELDDLAPEHLESVRLIERAGRHLLELVDEVLDVSRIASGTLSLSLEAVPVADVVRECVELIEPMARKRSLTITVMREDDLHVRADRQRLRQVLMNLLSNAVKYNRPGGSTAVGWHRHGDRVQIEVRDTGVGIAEQDMERLFEPFERMGAEAAGIEGTGLGLPLSRSLAEAMEGEIRVRSSVGEGSVFILELGLAGAARRR
jgi:PAS domain S-box-containing protein